MANLYTQYVNQGNLEMTFSETDIDIRTYIENASEDYTKVLQEDTRWDVFYHLSELRTSLLQWFDFKREANILEVGGEFGALTGLLCDKCDQVTTIENSLFRAEAISKRYAHRTNLDIYAGDLDEIHLDRKFDYIVLVGQMELVGKGSSDRTVYVRYLEKLRAMLNENGKILMAVENRYGVRYFSGAPEPHTGKVFDGINRYPQGTKGYSFSRQEIKDIVCLAGFDNHKFYYPLPDYKLPQLIYSEAYLPEKNLQERLIPYYLNSDSLLAYENDLYDDLIDNQVFEFFSNSFLIECSQNKDFDSVIYAAISGDRGKENGFATTIHSHGTVKKTPLYEEGRQSAARLYDNMMELKARGLNIVAHDRINESLIMPYITSRTLSNYLKSIVRTDPDQFRGMFDRLYEQILASSDEVPRHLNALCNEDNAELDWGIILEKAFLELIPLNSFYENDKIVFYDQEFVKLNYPAKYIMFRALHYMYIFAPYAEKYVSLKSMKEKYGLTTLWHLLLQEEERFLTDVRKRETHRHFYEWTRIDRRKMKDNAETLGTRQKDTERYEVSETMQKIWGVQLDLLKQLMRVCEQHNLKYYAVYGTLLGAVRHKGFIPWDDDIDIVMPREDYDKLGQLANSSFQEPYAFQAPDHNLDSFYGGFSRLRNSNTTGISLMDIGHKGNQGIWIDILPLDTCTSNSRKLQKKVGNIHKLQNLLYAKIYGDEYDKFRELSKLEWKMYRMLSKLIPYDFLSKTLNKVAREPQDPNSEHLGIFTHYNRYQPFNRSDFNETILLDFAGIQLPAPAGYKRCLEMSMGKDYMTYPPIEQRKPHHPGIFNPDLPYQKYNEMFVDLFGESKNKKIIIFGAGLMFQDYMNKHGDQYKPAFLVDNDASKWGTKRQGIEIKSPDDILKITDKERHIIICSVYYRQIEEQLKRMNVNHYKIYVQDKNWIVRDETQGR